MYVIDSNTLKSLEDKSKFVEHVHQSFYSASIEFGLAPHFNKAMALDAYFQWTQDLERIRVFEEKVREPDHIKKSAHLIYWQRRNSPINDFAMGALDGPADVDKEGLEFMLLYGREYLAFNLGYKIAKHYERSINGRELPEDAFSLQSSFSDVAHHDFLRTIVHVMKTKMLSPQALVMTLKALFLRP